ncbi:MAG: 2-oxo acid dehydrogenase subunit E2 [Candidatus Hydrogenedentes bacterium]|nr:2-oxo acid dehydrogenase subunit E2 [Candidatus Hydrogenedentota bacterium]
MKEIKMPQMGQSVEEATIVDWLKKEGDTVAVGDPIFTIQTDKAEIECEASESGVLRKILVPAGVEVPVFTVVALVGDAGEALPDLAAYGVKGGAASAPAPAPAAAAVEVTAPVAAVPVAANAPVSADAADRVSPRARKAAQSKGVPLEQVAGSGPEGRILSEDVLAWAGAQDGVRSTPTARKIARESGVDLTQVTPGHGGRVTKDDVLGAIGSTPVAPAASGAAAPSLVAGQVTPLTPMRRIIAQRMAESKFSAPHFYVTVEVDMQECVRFRNSGTAFKPSFNDLIMRATARAIQDFPLVNSRWKGDSVETVAEINLGFAVALDKGLVVPVLKRIERMSIQDINRESKVLIDKARNGKLLPDDYSGNTFTISNLGGFGVDHFTAIINQPDSAILAIGQIKDRVVVIDGGICVRPIMKLTLSSDHRVIDGSVAAQFMGRLKTVLEKADF